MTNNNCLVLPPNLPSPNIPLVYVLHMTPTMPPTALEDDLICSLAWWGASESENIRIGGTIKYVIACSLERFRDYLLDGEMVQIALKGTAGLLGVGVLRVKAEGEGKDTVEIKHSGRVVRKILVEYQIKQATNPYLRKDNLKQPLFQGPNRPSVIQNLNALESRHSLERSIDEEMRVDNHCQTGSSLFLRGKKHRSYEGELMRLQQQHDLLLAIRDIRATRLEIIELKFRSSIPFEVSLPLPGGGLNHYKFAKEGFVKFSIPRMAEDELRHYIKTCEVVVIADKIKGSVKFSKVLSHCGTELSVSLGKTKQTVYITAIKAEQSQNIPQNMPPNMPQNTIIKDVKQIKQSEQMVLLHVRRYRCLEERKGNYFVVVNGRESRTKWHQFQPAFNQTFVSLKSNEASFEVYDRGSVNILMGRGKMVIKGGLLLNVQVGIGRQRGVVGYLLVDYGVGTSEGIQELRKLMEVERSAQRSRVQVQTADQGVNVSKISAEEVIQRPKTPPQNEDVPAIPNVDKFWGGRIEPQLSLLDICNYAFLHLLKEETYLSETLTISLFSELLVDCPYLNNIHIGRLISLYLHRAKLQVSSIKDSVLAFQTYYRQIVKQTDSLLTITLNAVENGGFTLFDLENQGWIVLHALSNQDIASVKKRYGHINKLCDALRKFQVYETVEGEIMESKLLQEYIVTQIGLFIGNEVLSYRGLLDQLNELGAQITEWEHLNLREWFGVQKAKDAKWDEKREEEEEEGKKKQRYQNRQYEGTVQKGRSEMQAEKFPRETLNFENKGDNLVQGNTKLEARNDRVPPPEETTARFNKSPTFGFLHEEQMRAAPVSFAGNPSLMSRLGGLPISPIASHVTLHFSNLYQRLHYVCINGNNIDIGGKSIPNSASENISPLQNIDQSKEISREISRNISRDSLNYASNSASNFVSNSASNSVSNYASKSASKNIEPEISVNDIRYQRQRQSLEQSNEMSEFQGKGSIVLRQIQRMFSYEVELSFGEQMLLLDCIHGQWTGIVSEEGDYLGCIKID